ncbi:hypothetical protein K450DRAFT_194308 [Umbelopsis ramanniana AG]|uniref:Dolichyl-phosphate-mannose--protein mannosyltransferase n=1 Tax=Umbelopsis ramanniana AG TaxID=1314678 RepID=A0AAD5E2R6_UMBRA|nr:uncharacterized protein K450DRAFT_194308 [Umbelopsis ramanniana AG]KAI8575330.1 hypothetical protein K450DRAFT_194308 [Umbelopsis ramanniana AG]
MLHGIDTSVLGEFNTSYGVNQYMNGKFFIDRNPPLATLIYTLAARCFGYQGQKNLMYMGQPFADFPYVQLRLVSAVFGALQVPIAYITLKLMGHKSLTALVAAALLIVENGSISQHRHILTAAPLGFFAASSILMWVNFHNYQNNPYCFKWWTWQTLTGICIGGAMSVSWTGFLLLPLFWASSARQMWCLLGDRMNPITSIVKEVSSRILSMIIIPLGVYLLCFQVHFHLLGQSGDHDLLLSPELRSSINAIRVGSSQNDVAYGSKVHLRHFNSHVGYLHSHEHSWIDGSSQQQVTAYPFQDLNNGWVLQKADSLWNASQPINWVENKQKIRLEHFSTLKKLHSHEKHAPISHKLFEVTAYGDIFTEDHNDFWTVEIVDHDHEDATSKDRLKALSTKFRLKHSRGCYLTAHHVKLPDYAKGHFEVACRNDAKQEVSTWLVENSIHPTLKMVETDRVEYKKSNFYQKLQEVHGLMRNYDKVIPNADSVRFEASQPHQWLLNRETMQLWKEDVGLQVATALNPTVAWTGCAITVFYMLFSVLNSLLSKRGIQWPSFTRSQGSSEWRAYQTLPPKEFYVQSFGFLFTAIVSTSALTYVLPIQTNLSDSLLSVYFMILGTSIAFEVITIRLALGLRLIFFTAIFVASCYSFLKLVPTTYGTPWTKAECEISSSKFNCQNYPTPTINTQPEQEMQSVYVDVFGDTYTIDYQPGEEHEINIKAREIKFNAWKAKTQGTKVKERYIGVQSTPSAGYAEVKEIRKIRYKQMTARYLQLHPEKEQVNDVKEEDTANPNAIEQNKNGSQQKEVGQGETSNESQESYQVAVGHENSQFKGQVNDSEGENMAKEEQQHQVSTLEVVNADSPEQQVISEEKRPHEEVNNKQSEESKIQEQQAMSTNNENSEVVQEAQPIQDDSAPGQVQQYQEGDSVLVEVQAELHAQTTVHAKPDQQIDSIEQQVYTTFVAV